jgi:RNA polymerase sigma factor (sigma-70 family)
MAEVSPESPTASGGLFPRTHWSVILAAGDLSSPNNRQALDQFCEAYRTPVYFYLRGKGHQPAEADDLTQEFFAWFLQKEILAGLTREGSRFRTYLLTVLRNFLANRRRDQQAQKRGGGAEHLSIDSGTELRCLDQLSARPSPETLFDREWARAVSSRAFSQLQQEYTARGKQRLFECLQGCFPGLPAKATHAEIGRVLGMTEEAVRQEGYRMRRRYQELLRTEIAALGTREEDIEEEIRYLLSILRGE